MTVISPNRYGIGWGFIVRVTFSRLVTVISPYDGHKQIIYDGHKLWNYMNIVVITLRKT